MPECRSCSSARVRRLFSKDDFKIYRCLDCSLVFSDKSYPKEDIQGVYSEKYYDNIKNFSAITDKRYAVILQRLSKYNKGNRLLDLGCGTGQFILAAREKGWEASGIEVSADICRWARENLGLEIRCGDILSMELGEGYFDAVTMFESLEHLDDPALYLEKVNFILRRGGVLFLTTPNFASLSRRLLGAGWSVLCREHLSYFSPVTLKALLEKSGFRVARCVTKNFSFVEVKDNLLRKKKGNGFRPEQERLRERIEGSGTLQLIKGAVNKCLDMCSMGDSIWVFAEKAEGVK